jgi:hypothetical protein
MPDPVPPEATAWSEQQLSALGALLDAARAARADRALAGLPAIWQDIARAGGAAGRAVREMAAGVMATTTTTTATSSSPGTPRCWRCDVAASGNTRVPDAGPSPAGLRVAPVTATRAATRAQAHAPAANTPLQRIRSADWYLILLAVLLAAVLVLAAVTALALRDIHTDIEQATKPAASRACIQAHARVMATADAAKKSEGAGAHAQHEQIEETLIHEAETMEGACR